MPPLQWQPKTYNMISIQNLSATQLLEHLERGELTSTEITQYFIDQIKQLNPTLNAVVIDNFDAALKKAEEADQLFKQGKKLGELQGLPFTIKECFDFQGTPSTLGVMRRKSDIRQNTDPYIATLQNEGGIVLGKTNVAQLLMSFESCNPVYGVTNNPHNAAFTCGGSSGGEGAIIGAGASPVGIGTDIGGSVRIPAAFCGICSIKPTMARTVDHTRFIDGPIQLSINSVTGVLARHAEDLHLFLNVINQATTQDLPALKDPKTVDISQLKVGYFLSDGLFEPMPAIKRAVMEAVKQLQTIGVETVEFTPPDLLEAEALFFKILSADGAPLFAQNLLAEKAVPQAQGLLMLSKASPFLKAILSTLTGLLGQKSVNRIIPYFGGKGETFRQEQATAQKKFIEKYIQSMDHSPIGKLDGIISPACALPAYLHNTADKLGLGGTYTLQHNVSGFPAGIACISKVKPEEAVGRKANADLLVKTAAKTEANSSGLPLAVQIAARPWEEHIVLALIKQLHKPI